MSLTDKRLDKLYPSLTAEERAVLVIRAGREGKEEDPQVRRTIPSSQVKEFNHYIDLMNGVNVRLGHCVLVVELLLRELEMCLGWLQALVLWGHFASRVAVYLKLHTKEPVTEGEYQQYQKAARERMASVSELAEVLVERYQGWGDGDFQVVEGKEEPELTGAAWERVLAEKRQEVSKLVDAGVLVGRRRGRALLVNVGSFYDWLGEPCPVWPEWGCAYEVFPDSQLEEVRQRQTARRGVREAFRDAPSLPGLEELWPPAAKEEQDMNQVRELLRAKVCEGVQRHWRELRAVEMVVEEAAREFGGEDPGKPGLRKDMAQATAMVKGIVEGLALVGEHVGLPEPDEELLEQVREIVQPGS